MREDVKQPHVFIAGITKILPDYFFLGPIYLFLKKDKYCPGTLWLLLSMFWTCNGKNVHNMHKVWLKTWITAPKVSLMQAATRCVCTAPNTSGSGKWAAGKSILYLPTTDVRHKITHKQSSWKNWKVYQYLNCCELNFQLVEDYLISEPLNYYKNTQEGVYFG